MFFISKGTLKIHIFDCRAVFMSRPIILIGKYRGVLLKAQILEIKRKCCFKNEFLKIYIYIYLTEVPSISRLKSEPVCFYAVFTLAGDIQAVV